MKVSRSLVDCSVHSETHSHQRVGRELVCEIVKYLKVRFILPETIIRNCINHSTFVESSNSSIHSQSVCVLCSHWVI